MDNYFRVIVAGSRLFSNYWLLHDTLNALLICRCKSDILIVSGGAVGADDLGLRYAAQYDIRTKIYRPDWSRGKRAGYERNELMAQNADACVVFWDGVSRGSKHMIDLAIKYNLNLRVIRF